MADGLERIVSYFDEFRRTIDRCHSARSFRPEDWKGAYGALGRLRDRYNHEKEQRHLTPDQLAPLQKVFEQDNFIKGMMKLRMVSEHVTNRGGEIPIYTEQNIPVTVEGSANAVFASPIVVLPDVEGRPQEINHLQRLEEAKRRIDRSLAKAKSAGGASGRGS